MSEALAAREAQHGKRMIEVKVRFWTNDLADGRGRINPKHAWGSGVVRIARNEAHGIIPGKPLMFGSLLEMPGKIEKVLIDHGVTIHPSDRMRKYLT